MIEKTDRKLLKYVLWLGVCSLLDKSFPETTADCGEFKPDKPKTMETPPEAPKISPVKSSRGGRPKVQTVKYLAAKAILERDDGGAMESSSH